MNTCAYIILLHVCIQVHEGNVMFNVANELGEGTYCIGEGNTDTFKNE